MSNQHVRSPTAISFREVRGRFPVSGFHCHHIIPIEIVERRSLAVFFGHVRAHGFDPNDFSINGTHLPSTELQAAAFGLPLHRGGHPRYNEIVGDMIAPLTRMDPMLASARLRQLQFRLRTVLRPNRATPVIRSRGCFPANADFRRLDAAVDMLWGTAAPVLSGSDPAGLSRLAMP